VAFASELRKIAKSKLLSRLMSIKISLSELLNSGTAALPKPSSANVIVVSAGLLPTAAKSLITPTYLSLFASVEGPVPTYCNSNGFTKLIISIGKVPPVFTGVPARGSWTVALVPGCTTKGVAVVCIAATGLGAA
jgi:hypothetical protein